MQTLLTTEPNFKKFNFPKSLKPLKFQTHSKYFNIGIMAIYNNWMLNHVNARYIKLFHIQKELTCIRLHGII